MNFANIKSLDMKHEYKITISPDDIESQIMKVVEERAKTFRLPGFRKGHVPLNIVRQNIENQILMDVINDIIQNASNEIIKSLGNVEIASKPVYKIESPFEKGKDLIVSLNIETTPVFELKDFNIELKKAVPNITDEEIEKTKKDIMTNRPIFEKAEKEYSISNGDKVSYHAECFMNGVLSKKKSFDNVIIIPETIADDAEFLKGFIGKKITESFDFTPATDKSLSYKINIKSIQKVIKGLSFEQYSEKAGFKTPADLENIIKSGLENDFNNAAFLYHKHQILEYLTSNYNFELPESVVESETKNVIHSIRREIEDEKRRGTAKPEDLNKTDEDLAKEYADVTKKRVLLGYILNRYAKENNITASEDDLKKVIISEAQRDPVNANRIIEFYTSNRDAVAYKRAEIIERKVIEFLISKAKSVEEKMTGEQIKEIVNKILEEDDDENK